jgi:hypothetical protein
LSFAVIGEIKQDLKVNGGRCFIAAMSDALETATIFNRRFKRTAERIRKKSNCLDEVAFSGAIWAYQKGKWAQADIATSNAFVVC